MRLAMLAEVTLINEGEIAQELAGRNYRGGDAPATTPITTISRADAIKAAVNKILDQQGLARRASSLTYLEILRYSIIIADAKTWANYYLQGSQTPSSNLLSGLRGSKMNVNVSRFKGFSSPVYPIGLPAVPPPAQQGVSGWWMLLSLLGQGLITYAQYEMTKGYMTSQGYSFPATSGGTYETYRQELLRMNPNLSEAEIRNILSPYLPAKSGSDVPTWVWIGAGLGALYILTQKRA